MKRFADLLVRQPWLQIGLMATLSFLAWAFPHVDGLRRGFHTREEFTLDALAVLLLWYGALMLTCWVGIRVGRLIPRVNSHALSLNNLTPYVMFTGLACLGGIALAIETLKSFDLSTILRMLALGQGNLVRFAIYQDGDYEVGVLSLRYLSALSASFATYYALAMRRGPWSLHTLNWALFALTVFSAGRVALLAMLCILLALYGATPWHERNPIKGSKLLVSAALIFLMLASINYARNAGYYGLTQASVGDALFATLSEAMAYLGSPMQVFVGVVNNLDDVGAGTGAGYYHHVDVDWSLTTNSAFADVLVTSGWGGLVGVLVRLLVWSVIAGHALKHQNTYLIGVFGVVLYALSELWRIDMLAQGFYLALALSALVVPLVCRWLPHRAIRN